MRLVQHLKRIDIRQHSDQQWWRQAEDPMSSAWREGGARQIWESGKTGLCTSGFCSNKIRWLAAHTLGDSRAYVTHCVSGSQGPWGHGHRQGKGWLAAVASAKWNSPIPLPEVRVILRVGWGGGGKGEGETLPTKIEESPFWNVCSGVLHLNGNHTLLNLNLNLKPLI